MLVYKERPWNELETRGVVRINQRVKGNAMFLIIPPGWLDPLHIHRNADYGKTVSLISLEFLLPDRQSITAESPTCPAVNDVTLAEELAEADLVTS